MSAAELFILKFGEENLSGKNAGVFLYGDGVCFCHGIRTDIERWSSVGD